MADRVKWVIRKELNDAKYCIIVDECSDMSRKKQMAIVLRYVDNDGFVRERFFSLIHVPNTSSMTLKDEMCSVLSHYGLNIRNIRGQDYDGASNMRGEWNGLQALISNQCLYAYYIRCFAHRLQLTLVAASKEVIPVYQFFSMLNSTVTFVLGSCKRSDELRATFALKFLLYLTMMSLKLLLVKSFCESQLIDILDLSACYFGRRGRARHHRDNVSVEHHYRVDIFNATIDFQLQELNNRFIEKYVEFLIPSCALDPREWRKGFQADNTCKLVHKFCPKDFTECEKEDLRVQLLHFEVEILSILVCKSYLTFLICVIATTERAFSVLRIVKTRFRNKMDDEFLENCLVIYIEREIAKKLLVDAIVDGFRDMKECRALL
ncbi:uncharacterized protein LOC104896670 [Beta vulgaris subsp. vulgaris]|uniref:uncharacterized protein LOC104896670 n=1 Tax=Beta vulgaris subsp. vulgaris TaxID=3555 RepID=UPI002037114C|nr:uncharacterized protein LOC104896670 [Beta vulgaris subsp. vulgaris]